MRVIGEVARVGQDGRVRILGDVLLNLAASSIDAQQPVAYGSVLSASSTFLASATASS